MAHIKNKDPHFEKTVGIGGLSIYDGDRRISYVESSAHVSSVDAVAAARSDILIIPASIADQDRF